MTATNCVQFFSPQVFSGVISPNYNSLCLCSLLTSHFLSSAYYVASQLFCSLLPCPPYDFLSCLATVLVVVMFRESLMSMHLFTCHGLHLLPWCDCCRGFLLSFFFSYANLDGIIVFLSAFALGLSSCWSSFAPAGQLLLSLVSLGHPLVPLVSRCSRLSALVIL